MTDEKSNKALLDRYELLKGAEQHKNALIEELLHRLNTVTLQYQREHLDLERESQYNRDGQMREFQLKEELRRTKAVLERDPFVLVLIDGDGMIFDEQLLSKGEQGGKEAAGLLWGCVRDYVNQKDPDLPSDIRIVTRIYANLKGLADVCCRAGLVEKSSVVDDFARGFTGSKQLFDYIDVGSGKDRADDKLTEIFKLHLYDCHCRHIIFGCSHDNGYARLLEDLLADKPTIKHITLLEGVPFERELANLKNTYETTKFRNLFRTTKISIYQPPPPLPQPQFQFQPPPPPPPTTTTRTPSIPNSTLTMNPTAPSWASTAMTAPATIASAPPTPNPPPATVPGIPRNRYGQRVDAQLQYDKSEVNRVKKIHMCNVHYLRRDCPYGVECTHDHGYKPSKNELTTLKYIARMTPCRFGTECDDLSCIYGHRCPLSRPGFKDCHFGENCRFEVEMHGVDTNVVKIVRV